MGSKSTQFEMLGYHHVALVCADMQNTVDFYEGVLGFPLVKTLEYGAGRGQHFFFQVTEDDGVAFFYFTDAPPPQPGLTGAPWQFSDENGRPADGIVGVAAKDAMHHMAFDVPLDKIDEYREKLIAAGVEVQDVERHTTDGHGNSDGECIRSLYFRDPDGIMLEFAAMTRPFTDDDVHYAPARAEDAAARLQPGKVAVTV